MAARLLRAKGSVTTRANGSEVSRMAMTTHQAMQCRLRICMLIEGGLHAVWTCLARLIASDRCPLGVPCLSV